MPRLRFVIAGLLCLASASNYLDRQALSVLADTVKRDLGLSAADYADINSAFLLAYMVMYLVGGWIVDRIGTRRSFLLFASAWSLATMAHGLVSSLRGFQGARLLLGATQPVNFPAGCARSPSGSRCGSALSRSVSSTRARPSARLSRSRSSRRWRSSPAGGGPS